MYEFIYERNGGANYRVYNYYLINSTVAASYIKDIFYNHPSQKPLTLMRKLIIDNTKVGDIIFDPFMGTGTTILACIKENRNYIGCEINSKTFKIASDRLSNYKLQKVLF